MTEGVWVGQLGQGGLKIRWTLNNDDEDQLSYWSCDDNDDVLNGVH